MFSRIEPMDSDTRAILIGVLGVTFLVIFLLVSLAFLAARSNDRKIPAKIARIHALEHMADTCKGLQGDSAITLCLSQIPAP